MATVRIVDRGFEATVEALTRFSRNPERALAPTFRAWGNATVATFRRKKYGRMTALQRSGGGYQRTGTFGRSWRGIELGASHFMVQNNATQKGRVYPMYVVGDGEGKRQARVHAPRWWKARPIFEERYMRILVENVKREFIKLEKR